jgi:hypothetical protein
MSVCLRCGYDLRATPAEAACPECGLAAHRSVIEHSHPDDCPPRWVAMIAAAAVMLLVSYVGFGLFLMLMLVRAANSIIFIGDVGIMGIYCGLVALAILHAVANILLSRDDRKHSSRGISRSYRWVMRILPLLPIAGLVGMGTFIFWIQFYDWWMWLSAGQSIMAWLIAALILCPPFTFFRLRSLALRLSRPRLAEHVTIVAVGCAASLAFMMFCAVAAWGGVRHADIYFFLLMVLPWVLVALFNLWAMLLLFLVAERFLQSAREARARWAAADAARVGV